jgi:hypothetical protein
MAKYVLVTPTCFKETLLIVMVDTDVTAVVAFETEQEEFINAFHLDPTTALKSQIVSKLGVVELVHKLRTLFFTFTIK